MPLKLITIPLDDSYLNEMAKARGISRTMLTRLIMERVIEGKLIPDLMGSDMIVVPRQAHYRRLKLKR